MAEPVAKPNKEQIRKAVEYYGDPMIYWATNSVIRGLNNWNTQEEGITNFKFREWTNQTRLILKNMPLAFIINEVYQIYEDISNDYYRNFKMPSFKEKKEKVIVNPDAKLIKDKIKITDIAKIYGLKVKGNKSICPFHDDKDPSLSLNNEKGIFHCFGCETSGNIIKFVQCLEDAKD